MEDERLARVRARCEARLNKLLTGRQPLAEDTATHHAGEVEGWRTCLRVLNDLPTDRNPAQAMFTLAGSRADFSSQPKHRQVYDRERGFMTNSAYQTWSLGWNRVLSRVQGWLEAEYGVVEYEDVKDLPGPPLPYLDETDAAYQKDLAASMDAMLGRRKAP